jgi:hypothetical protein
MLFEPCCISLKRWRGAGPSSWWLRTPIGLTRLRVSCLI